MERSKLRSSKPWPSKPWQVAAALVLAVAGATLAVHTTAQEQADRRASPARNEQTQRNPASDHWAYQPLIMPAVPVPVDNAAWPRTPVDAFVLARLQEKGLAPSPDADRQTLARRLSLDVLGFVPDPALVASFVADTS
ncbi:MAG TPA: DUF1549 domain-containing protein, partial [Hyphomicrobiales bacterium]|nr:DUF1549 domain-containing protein [Hyphomicrobiales bacterium]